MLTHRRWTSLDSADHGWLQAKYHFIVSADGNPAHSALGPLVVWNDDEIAPGHGFPMHGHQDMEIVTYVRQGILGHRDSLGEQGSLHAGDVQVVSAGSGIRHTEFNQGEGPLRLYQIWLLPRTRGEAPRGATRRFPKADKAGRFAVLASGFGEDREALPLRADARLLAATLQRGEQLRQPLDTARQAYLVVASGRIEVDGQAVGALDGVAITDACAIHIHALEDSELVMVDAG